MGKKINSLVAGIALTALSYGEAYAEVLKVGDPARPLGRTECAAEEQTAPDSIKFEFVPVCGSLEKVIKNESQFSKAVDTNNNGQLDHEEITDVQNNLYNSKGEKARHFFAGVKTKVEIDYKTNNNLKRITADPAGEIHDPDFKCKDIECEKVEPPVKPKSLEDTLFENLKTIVQLPGKDTITLVYNDMTMRDSVGYNDMTGEVEFRPNTFKGSMKNLIPAALYTHLTGLYAENVDSNNSLIATLSMAQGENYFISEDMSKSDMPVEDILADKSTLKKGYTGKFTKKELIEGLAHTKILELIGLEAAQRKTFWDVSKETERRHFVAATKNNLLTILLLPGAHNAAGSASQWNTYKTNKDVSRAINDVVEQYRNNDIQSMSIGELSTEIFGYVTETFNKVMSNSTNAKYTEGGWTNGL